MGYMEWVKIGYTQVVFLSRDRMETRRIEMIMY